MFADKHSTLHKEILKRQSCLTALSICFLQWPGPLQCAAPYKALQGREGLSVASTVTIGVNCGWTTGKSSSILQSHLILHFRQPPHFLSELSETLVRAFSTPHFA